MDSISGQKMSFLGFILAVIGFAAGLVLTPVPSAKADPTLPDVSSLLSFPLYKNEKYWGGSQKTENESFLKSGLELQEVQAKLRSRARDGLTPRVFHNKQHGCFTGQLIVRDQPTYMNQAHYTGGKTFQSIFNPKNQKVFDKVVVRFSNGLGIVQHDKEPDVRGMAVKVFGVRTSPGGNFQTVDLLTTNSPTPGGDDFFQFADFMKLTGQIENPTLVSLAFFKMHPRAALSVIKASLGEEPPIERIFDGSWHLINYSTKSMATQRYWSGHPYLLGDNLAMKFNFSPVETTELSAGELERLGENYLKADLARRARAKHLRFVVSLQLEKNSRVTPIEHNLTEWTEKNSPSIQVADLVLDQQDLENQNAAELDRLCKEMTFSPGHFDPKMRALSTMGRGRIFAYKVSEMGRNGVDDEPTGKIVERMRTLNQAK